MSYSREMFVSKTIFKQIQWDKADVPYILESNPHPNLIPISFCPFLKRKRKMLVRGSNPHLSFNRPLPTGQTDSVMSDDGESDE